MGALVQPIHDGTRLTGDRPADWITWLRHQALPLWSTAGFDRASGSFVERLGLDGAPLVAVPRRVMVQARQIHVYATAARNGWLAEGADLALRAGDAMIAHYAVDEGLGGWVFACDARGAVVDSRRDLYAQAFVLLALASLIALDPRPRYRRLVERTLTFLDREMAHPAGGFVEQWPEPILPRRQNPHMHLLEALLALQEAGGCGDLTGRIAALIALFDARFLPGHTDVLAEFYDAGWQRPDEGKSFEPGHHFEWVWLLTRHAELTGADVAERIDRLFASALRGVDARGGVVDEVGEGGPVVPLYRLWPAMEAAKAFAIVQGRAMRSSGLTLVLSAAWEKFVQPAVPGGWIDRVEGGNPCAQPPLIDHMPASSLYHVCTAMDFLR